MTVTETRVVPRHALDLPRHSSAPEHRGVDYKWIALTNTTLGVFMATVNSSVVLISLPAIFRGIHLNPLAAQNVSYLLWMLMGYMLITAVLVVSLGRLGDMYGRVKIYNAGFAVFALASVALALVPFDGGAAALWLIGFRVVQGIGGAMLMANSTAILTDAFPAHQRGMALGINQVAALAGSFGGLVIGGILSEWHWRAVFWVSVPVGVVGAIWAYRSLREISQRRAGRIDWWGNLTFAVGLIAVLAGITYGIQPYGGSAEGWGNPAVVAALVGGVLVLIAFVVIERRVAQPMFHLELFRIRTFWTGNFATLMSSVARGGLQFMLIIWLQGIWLPLHGYDYESTPLWAGIYLLPLTVGFLIAGPLSGFLSDRFGPRPFTVGGPLLVAVSFVGLLLLPADFSYPAFAALLALNGIGSGLFSAPNTTAIMNAVPREQRGAAGGMSSTFMNAGMVLSIGVFFSLLIAGLAGSLPHAMQTGLAAQGVPASSAASIAALPPVGILFAAFLGYNPIAQLLTQTGAVHHLSSAQLAVLTGKEFFPHLIADPFRSGLVLVFAIATVMVLLAGVAAALRGKKYVYAEPTDATDEQAHQTS
ncbi:MFS family permease [Friedmanniella endophytica]|uniref:MFS family permease n=1 Tax=Microlunatus kandeliicorticis TaxID=1759536 RepID=A0A7W3IVT6_9ACTN|nr:MFS transporter [Microlunatus kandeliicorticis]MBA8796100.1 MFS family permease [Microlunatus kandeliicorticis]